jgi:hypothetical protein
VSAFAATFTGGCAAAEILAAVPFGDAAGVFVEEGIAELPGVAGAVCTDRFVCGGRTGGFGEKNRVHNKITPIESRDAASNRIS